MRNITLSVPDQVYRTARITAAELGVSVSALVRSYLESLAPCEDEFERAAEERRRIVATVKHFSASDRLSRDEIHDRAALR